MERSATTSATSALLRHAAERALLAPSIHNTQPWRFVITGDELEIQADETRQLRVLDARGRQLTISCGSALFNARVAIAATGHLPLVDRVPDPYRPELLARIRVGERCESPIGALDYEITRRHTNRRAFMGDPPPGMLLHALRSSARAEGVALVAVTDPQRQEEVAQLSGHADRIQRSDNAYLAEMLAWTTSDIHRRDGVQAMTIPYAVMSDADEPPLAVRDFDVRGMGWLPTMKGISPKQCLLVLCTPENSKLDWLRAGEALERVWLEITRAGYWASPLNQVVEVSETNEQLRIALNITAHPQLLLRVGQAPEVPATPRRQPDDIIEEQP